MYNQLQVFVVLPAYNAYRTLKKTYDEIPFDIVDQVILCDDFSTDETVELARELKISHIIQHTTNRGYGANQKSLYDRALKEGADIIIMLHPDYQYDPRLITPIAGMIADGSFDVVLGSRILGKGALKGGMPLYKYVSNRALTFFQNIMLGQKLSEYHTGYRAYHRRVLDTISYGQNSDDFVFDNQVLSQIIYASFSIGEISCPARYFPEASSINLRRSIRYGLGVLQVSVEHFLQRCRLIKLKRYEKKTP